MQHTNFNKSQATFQVVQGNAGSAISDWLWWKSEEIYHYSYWEASGQYMGLAVKVCVIKSKWRFFSIEIEKSFIPHPWPTVYFVTPPAYIRYDITYHVCMGLYRDVKYYQMWHHDRYTDLQYKKAKYYSTQSWYLYWNKGPIIPDDELHCN